MLNDKLIRALKPESKLYLAKDAGLFLDVRPTGAKFYRDSAGKVQTRTVG